MAQQKDTKRGTWFFHGSCKDILGKTVRYCRRGFKTKKEAKEAEHLFRLQMEESGPTITLNELRDLYQLNAGALSVKDSTLVTDRSTYDCHIKADLGELSLKAFTVPFLDKWRTKLANTKKPDGSAYAPATINKVMEALSRYFSYAVRLGYMEYNPCHSLPAIKGSRGPNAKKRPVFWEQSTFNYFLSCVDDPYWYDVFLFLFGTGCREGEMFALQWADIDLGSGKVHISKTITSKTTTGKWALTSPKTERSDRYIDLQEALLVRLRARFSAEKKKDGFSSSWFVFGHLAPLSRTQLARFLDKYIELAGVPRITPHGFRHSHATLLIRSGIDDQLIADRLGHTPAELRKTYAHIYADSRKEMIQKLNEIF